MWRCWFQHPLHTSPDKAPARGFEGGALQLLCCPDFAKQVSGGNVFRRTVIASGPWAARPCSCCWDATDKHTHRVEAWPWDTLDLFLQVPPSSCCVGWTLTRTRPISWPQCQVLPCSTACSLWATYASSRSALWRLRQGWCLQGSAAAQASASLVRVMSSYVSGPSSFLTEAGQIPSGM